MSETEVPLPLKTFPPLFKSLVLQQLGLRRIILLSLLSKEAAKDVMEAGIKVTTIKFQIGEIDTSFQVNFVIKKSGKFVKLVSFYFTLKTAEKFKKQTFRIETITGEVFENCQIFRNEIFIDSSNDFSTIFKSLHNHFCSVFSKFEQSELSLFAQQAEQTKSEVFLEPNLSFTTVKLFGEWENASRFDKIVEGFQYKQLHLHDNPPKDSQATIRADFLMDCTNKNWLTEKRIMRMDVREIELDTRYSGGGDLSLFNFAVTKWSSGEALTRLEQFTNLQTTEDSILNEDRDFITQSWNPKRCPGWFCDFWVESGELRYFYDLRDEQDVERSDGTLGTVFKHLDSSIFLVWTEENFENVKNAPERVEKERIRVMRELEESKGKLPDMEKEKQSLEKVLEKQKQEEQEKTDTLEMVEKANQKINRLREAIEDGKETIKTLDKALQVIRKYPFYKY